MVYLHNSLERKKYRTGDRLGDARGEGEAAPPPESAEKTANDGKTVDKQPEAHFIKHILQVDRLNLLVLGY